MAIGPTLTVPTEVPRDWSGFWMPIVQSLPSGFWPTVNRLPPMSMIALWKPWDSRYS
ncbi:hypothetical protein D3C73_1669220 [compost metagenome]